MNQIASLCIISYLFLYGKILERSVIEAGLVKFDGTVKVDAHLFLCF